MLTRIEGGGRGIKRTGRFLGAFFLLLLSPVFPGGTSGSSTEGKDSLRAILSSMKELSAQEVRYSGSVSYSAGRYFFDETTRSFYFGSTLALDLGSFDLSVSVPIVVQNGGLVTLVGGVPVPTGGEQSAAVGGRQSGGSQGSQGTGHGGASAAGTSAAVVTPLISGLDALDPSVADNTDIAFSDSYTAKIADPFFQGSVTLYEGFGLFRSFGTRLGVKPPVASVESGVGTGQWDFGAGTTFVLGSGSTLLFGDLGYWSYGDLTELELEDGFTYAGGFTRPFLGSKASLMLSIAGAQALIRSAESPLTAAIGLGYSFENGRMANVSLAAGLSETSPDLSVTIGWTLGSG